jgi:hypothetical protein
MTESFMPSIDGMPPADGEGRKRPPLPMVVGAGAVVLALAAGGWFLLGGSGGSSDEPMAMPVHHLVQPGKAPKAAAAGATKKATVLPAVSKAQLGRDPFVALYIAPAMTTTGSASGSTVTPTTTTSTGNSSTGNSSTTTSPTTTYTAPKTYALKLSRVYGSGSDRTAVFVIAGRTQVAKVGSTFGPTSELKLLSVSQNAKGVWVATLQEGDSDPFDAITGQRIYVR